MTKAVFGLEPLGCPTCINKIKNTLQKIDGMEDVKVLFHSNRVRTQFNGSIVSVDDIQEAIIKLGYPVISQKTSQSLP